MSRRRHITHPHIGIHVEAKKEGNRIPLFAGRVAHAMDGRDERIVRDTLQEIANIDDKSAMDVRRRNVDAIFVQNFEAADLILVQDSEGC